MGAYAPAPVITEQILETIRHTIIKPTLLGMAKEGRVYKGCLYVGLMITQTGPKVIEFNCRFGDPETQVVLPLFEDDLVDLMMKSVTGGLPRTVNMNKKSAVCVVIASGGYPDAYETGKEIFGLMIAGSVRDVIIFHAGTARQKDILVTDGGRVLGVTALGPAGDLQITIDNAYRAVEKITFNGAYYRSDIGKKGAERMKKLSAGKT
jgi:phosphoribosylamine--glycine ligase